MVFLIEHVTLEAHLRAGRFIANRRYGTCHQLAAGCWLMLEHLDADPDGCWC
jgi:hypothetical protein